MSGKDDHLAQQPPPGTPKATAEQATRFASLRAGAWTGLAVLLAAAAGATAQAWGADMRLLAGLMAFAGLGGWSLGRWAHGHGASRDPDDDRQKLGLPTEVVPIWKRNIVAAKEDSERSMSSLLESFANVSVQLDNALGQNADLGILELGVADRLIEERQPEIDTLLVTTRQAVAMKDQLLETLTSISQALAQMESFSRQVQEIGRATNLMALNASVEATRAGNSGSGFAVVATEVRRLASQSRMAASSVGKLVRGLQEQLDGLKLQARRMDTDQEELTLKAEESARAVVRGLLDSLAQTNRSSRTLRDTGRQVQEHIERIMMGLQSQDRLSQMLVAVCDDMERMNEWLRGADDPNAHLPALWLERLAQHYTMEEQHSVHHDTVRIERTATVEFF
jgi:methyl-accepting chemotaxis protein